jgi:hypothetical protein
VTQLKAPFPPIGAHLYYWSNGTQDIHAGKFAGIEKRSGKAQSHYLIATRRGLRSIAESLVRRGMMVYCEREHRRCMAEVRSNRHNEIGALIGAADWQTEGELWRRLRAS